MSALRIGLLGAGRIGRIHGTNVARHPRATLAAIADPDAGMAEALARETGARVADVGDILADPAIGAVVICTPTDLHAEQIEAAAKAGKAIFCEKPVSLDAARTRACLKAAGAAGAKLMIGFNRRFDPSFAAVRRRIEAGEIGAVEIVTILSRDPSPPPAEYAAR